MLRYALHRAAQALGVLVIASITIFGILHAAPGDPATYLVAPDAPPQAIAAARLAYGLDKPLWTQYWDWLSHLFQGDLGTSYSTGQPVADMIAGPLGATSELALAAIIVIIPLAIINGLLCARHAGRLADWLLSGVNSLLYAIPSFWLGIILILIFGLWLRVLPIGGSVGLFEHPAQSLRSVILPALALGLPTAAVMARFLRTSTVDQLRSDYIRASIARGQSERRVLTHHAFPNALVPVSTVFGVQVAHMVGGAVVIESVFSWPGLGMLTINAIEDRDYTVVQASLLLLIVMAVIVNFVVDISYGLLDPRIRVRGQRR